MNNIVKPSFFARPVLEVCPELLGKFLVRSLNSTEQALMITEVEAYDGPQDKACHGRFGKTKRTEPMFGPAGHFYVYLIYGMYWMLNIVTDKPGYPSAILIRGTLGLSGPGRLTRRLHIDGALNGMKMSFHAGLWIEDHHILIAQKNIIRTPRIGIAYAQEWKDKLYRFILKT